MATDKPGVMTFLNPELYKRVVTFKETHRLRSLSHAVELALGEYFGVAIAPVTRDHPSSSAEPLRSPETLTAKVDQLVTEHAFLHQAVLNLQHMVEPWVVRTVSTVPVKATDAEPPANLSGAPLMPFSCRPFSTPRASQSETLQPPKPMTDGAESVVSAALARKGLTGLQLASRLHVHSSVISRKKQKPYFKAWTSQLDPIGMGWKYVAVTRRFHPVDRQ